MKVILLFVMISIVACKRNEESSTKEDVYVYDEANFEHICKGVEDYMGCLRKYIAKIARCRPVRKTNTRPVMLKGMHLASLPMAQATFHLKDPIFAVNGTVEAAYVDKKTNNLVLSFHLTDAYIDIKDCLFLAHQRSAQPKQVHERAYATYDVTITGVFPLKSTITASVLQEGLVTPDLPLTYKNFYFGPKVTDSKDPVVAKMSEAMLRDPPTAIAELFQTGAHYFYESFMHKYICDFGLPYVEVKHDI